MLIRRLKAGGVYGSPIGDSKKLIHRRGRGEKICKKRNRKGAKNAKTKILIKESFDQAQAGIHEILWIPSFAGITMVFT